MSEEMQRILDALLGPTSADAASSCRITRPISKKGASIIRAADRLSTKHRQTGTITDVNSTSARLADGPVTIQLPQLERRTIDFQSDLRDGESILVACPPPSDGEGHFFMALTVRVLNEEDGVSFFVPASPR